MGSEGGIVLIRHGGGASCKRSPAMMPCRVLKPPLRDAIEGVFRDSRRSLTLASPFITRAGLEALKVCIGDRQVSVMILTSVRAGSVQRGFLDLDALAKLARDHPLCCVHHQPGLHAKVYSADDTMAVVCSANLTSGGLDHNYEVGVRLDAATAVAEVTSDLRRFAGLGAELSPDQLAELAEQAEALRGLEDRSELRLRRLPAWKRLQKAVMDLEIRIVRQRIRGRSVNAIFTDTIRYLLASGPKSTGELHPLIQAIHPDLCDDREERVIDGQRFGKRWKHLVRSAQQTLRGRGEIELRAGQWRLRAPVPGRPGE